MSHFVLPKLFVSRLKARFNNLIPRIGKGGLILLLSVLRRFLLLLVPAID